MSRDKNQKQIDFSSLMSTAVVALPAGVGLSIGALDVYKGGFAASPNPIIPKSLSIPNASKSSVSSDAFSSFIEKNASFMREPEGSEIARKAWVNAVRATTTSNQQILDFSKGLETAPSEEVFSSINRSLQNNQSLYSQRVFRKFKKNLRAYKKHLKKTGSIPLFEEVENLSFPPRRNLAVGQLPDDIGRYFSDIQKELGASGEVFYHTRKGWEKEKLGLYEFAFTKGGRSFTIPVPYSSGGVLVEGPTQSSRRISRPVAIFDTKANKIVETMPRHAFMLEDFQRSILPHITSGDLKGRNIQQAIDDMYEENIRKLESTPNLPPDKVPRSWRDYERVKSQNLDIRIREPGATLKSNQKFGSVFRFPDEKERIKATENTGLFPSGSPTQLAQGARSTHDPREWYMTPQDSSFARRPMQGLREWKATSRAVQEMTRTGASKWSIFETQAWRRDLGHLPSSPMRTLYLDPTNHADLIRDLGMGDGESLLMDTRSLRLRKETSRVAFPKKLKSLVSGVEERILKGEGFKHGEILGHTDTGSPFTYKSNMKILGLEDGSTSGVGDFKSLIYEETAQRTQASKGFLHLKSMERWVDPKEARKTIRRHLGKGELTKGVEAIAFADELVKDPAKLNHQMITSLWDFMEQRRDLDFVRRRKKLQAFMRNPRVFASYARSKASSQKEFTRTLISLATAEGRMSPDEFGTVFGALPSAFGKEDIEDLVPNATYRKALSGGALGIAAPLKGNFYSGMRGSLEPRFLDTLRGPAFGEMGEELTQDLVGRMAATNPEGLAANQSLTRTLASVARKDNLSGLKAFDLSKGFSSRDFQDFIEEGGGALKIGKGLPDVYVPGSDQMGRMGTFLTAGGKEVSADVAREYRNFASSMSDLYGDSPISKKDAEAKMLRFAGTIQRQQAPLGKKGSAGAFLREVTGSKYFTGVSEVKGYRPPNMWTVGIPKDYMAEMFEEMESSGLYKKSEIREMGTRLAEEGQIAGLIWRDPSTGPRSAQLAMFQLTRSPDPFIAIPNKIVNVGMNDGAAKPLNLGPLVGTRGDLDADSFAASLLSPDLEKKARQTLTNRNNAYTTGQVQHALRDQLLRTKSPSMDSSLLTPQQFAADAEKLGTPQNWVGKLSVSIGEGRTAAMSRLSGQRAENAAHLLEFLENVPIAGKHASAEAVRRGELSSLFETLDSGLTSRNRGRIENTVRQLASHASPLAQEILDSDIRITSGLEDLRRTTGISNLPGKIPSMNLSQAVDDVVTSMELSDQAGITEMENLARGRGRLTSENLGKYLNFSNDLLGSGAGSASKAQSAALAAKNIMAAAGQGILKSKKAIGFGFAGSIALATILSKPDEMIGPGSNLTNEAKVNMSPGKGADRVKPETIAPQGQQIGNPSVPRRIHTPKAVISPGSHSMRADVSARGSASSGQVMSQVRTAHHGASVTLNVRDNSSPIDKHLIANKMFE